MKSAEEIESEYRAEYPEIHLGGGVMVSTGHPRYEDFIAFGVRNLVREQASSARAAARATLRADWAALPTWIRGPYRPLFDAANQLLDEGADDDAVAMIEYAEPSSRFAEEPAGEPFGELTKLEVFNQIKAAFVAKVAAL